MNNLRSKLPILYQLLLRRNKATVASSSLNKIKSGQPTAYSHPHLLKQGEIVPFITSAEFQERRQKLVDLVMKRCSQLKLEQKSHLFIIPSATRKYMSDKIPYVFRQNTDYLYLSGCMEPDTCLIISANKNSTSHKSTLFVRNPDNHAEIWDGPRSNVESAPILFGIDHSLPMSDLQSYVNSFLTGNNDCVIWYELADNIQPTVNKAVTTIVQNHANIKIEPLKYYIQSLRLIKSPAEIALMTKSCEIASESFNETIGSSKAGITEHQLYAKIDYECRTRGAEYLAYPPVVAGKERATIIHYINNNQVIDNGSLVLMDAGCEYHGYSSDITRTWPINGEFNPEQKILYEVIQSVQNELIQVKLLQDNITLDGLFNSMCIILGKKLQEIGLIPKNITADVLYKRVYEFCPHHVSHYLGMDVHDTHLMSRSITLKPGMIITIEPGIYLNSRHNVPEKFQDIGIRIEDDVLITENGPAVLTNKCIRKIEEIKNVITSKF